MISLKETIEKIFQENGKEEILLKSKISKILAEILGENISAGIHIKSIKNGKLSLKSMNSIWAFEISINKESIIKKLNDKLGNNLIRDISSR
jgi:PIN domain nuclease of toxin-antitoxin system